MDCTGTKPAGWVNGMFLLGLVLLFIAVAFYAMENMLLAVIFAGAALFVFLGTLLHRSAKHAVKKAGKSKIAEEVENAEPSHPSKELIGEGLKNLGEMAGDHAFKEKNIWTMSSKDSNVRERTGRSSKNFIDKFRSS